MHKLAIVGYGKMGRMIEALAPEYGFSVHARIDVNDDISLARGADVAIEFSTPDSMALGLGKFITRPKKTRLRGR
jgi:4-hydroxy-tetrahydrodipicolinate reductase